MTVLSDSPLALLVFSTYSIARIHDYVSPVNVPVPSEQTYPVEVNPVSLFHPTKTNAVVCLCDGVASKATTMPILVATFTYTTFETRPSCTLFASTNTRFKKSRLNTMHNVRRSADIIIRKLSGT